MQELERRRSGGEPAYVRRIPTRPVAARPALTIATGATSMSPPVRPIPFPSLRRNVCPHFYLTSRRGPMAVHAPHLLKALSRQDDTVSRCQLRGGVHLEGGYVNDVCLGAAFNQCVFFEDGRLEDGRLEERRFGDRRAATSGR